MAPASAGFCLRVGAFNVEMLQAAQSSRVEVISQTLAAANLDFINLIEVVDESAATAVRERLKALVALSAFLGGEGIGEPGRGDERDGAEAAHTAIATAAAAVAGGAKGGAGCGSSPPPATTPGTCRFTCESASRPFATRRTPPLPTTRRRRPTRRCRGRLT